MDRRIASLLVIGLAAFTACTVDGDSTTTTTLPAPVYTHEVLGATDLYLPSGAAAAPLVVLVPGGAWRTADPSGLVPLAEALAASGIAAAPTTVGAAEDGVVYPVPVEDALCAAAAAAAAMEASGVSPDPVVLFGHSTGAHLAALAALAAARYHPSCDAPAVTIDGLIGVSGTYDVDLLPDVAVDLFGVDREAAPDVWDEGNAANAVALRPELPVLLIHGDADPLVPVSFTEEYGRQLEEAGHPVTVVIVAGADHHEVYGPGAVAATISDWVRRLSA